MQMTRVHSISNQQQIINNKTTVNNDIRDDALNDVDDSFGCCAYLLIGLSYFLLIITFPIAIFSCVKIVTEYERAVILRLGRKLPGGAKGPGLFFILPCIDDII